MQSPAQIRQFGPRFAPCRRLPITARRRRSIARRSAMGACPAKPQGSPAQPESARDRSPSDLAASKLAQKVSTNVDPVMLRTRGVTKKDVLDQRRTATERLSSLRNTSDDSASPRRSAAVAQLRSSRLALGPARSEGSLSRRMSRISTMGRRQIVEGIQAAADSHGGQGSGLGRRLESLGLSSLEMEGDGNCQVRLAGADIAR